jgi:hypothetical protein
MILVTYSQVMGNINIKEKFLFKTDNFTLKILPKINKWAASITTLLQVEKLIATSMDPDQTAGMRRLVWIHAGRKRTMLVLSWRRSNHGLIEISILNLIIYKAAHIQIHPDLHENFENVFRSNILWSEQRK